MNEDKPKASDYSEEEMLEMARSDKVNRKIEEKAEKEGKKKNWKKAHDTEYMIKHGLSKLSEDLTLEQQQFHNFGVGMLKFEHTGQITGDKGFILFTMKQTAKSIARQNHITITRKIIKSAKNDYLEHDKTTLEGFYFRTVCRYLKTVSVR